MPPKAIRRHKPITPPINIDRTTKMFQGFTVMTDQEENTTVTAHWEIPKSDGTLENQSLGVLAPPIHAMPGFDDIVDAIVAASE